MYKIKAICDRCGKEEEQDGKYFNECKNNWGNVKFEISRYSCKDYLFCLKCRQELGLWKPDKPKTPPIETLDKRLFDCIAEIVAMQQQEDQEAEIMGELGDWGYWLLFIVMAAICYIWGYANGYAEGKKDGQKEKRHIDAKVQKNSLVYFITRKGGCQR